MTKSNTDIPILDDDAVAEIEALSAKVPDGPWFVDKDDAEDVPDHRRSGLALVDTGRSADWWIARLCEWHIARFIAESKTNVDALCQTVRALKADLKYRCEALEEMRCCRDRWLTMLNPVSADETVDGAIRNLQQVYISERDNAVDLQSQLEQVTKERDALSLALKNELTAMPQPAHRDYECMSTIPDETLWCATCAARAEYLRGRSDAAAACIKKVKAKAAKYQALADDSLPNDQTAARMAAAAAALNSVAKELESLTLQKQEAKQ